MGLSLCPAPAFSLLSSFSIAPGAWWFIPGSDPPARLPGLCSRHMTGASIILISGSGHGSAGHPASQQCPCLHVVPGRGGISSLEDPLIPGKVLQVKEPPLPSILDPLFKLQKTKAKQNNATQARIAAKVNLNAPAVRMCFLEQPLNVFFFAGATF